MSFSTFNFFSSFSDGEEGDRDQPIPSWYDGGWSGWLLILGEKTGTRVQVRFKKKRKRSEICSNNFHSFSPFCQLQYHECREMIILLYWAHFHLKFPTNFLIFSQDLWVEEQGEDISGSCFKAPGQHGLPLQGIRSLNGNNDLWMGQKGKLALAKYHYYWFCVWLWILRYLI